LVVARFMIPMEYLAPMERVTWLGFAVESGLLLIEMVVLVTFFLYLPRIVCSVKESPLSVIYAFSKAVNEKVKPYPIVRVICSEMLVMYYSFASWKKKPVTGEGYFTLHKKSSYIALMVMLIHATVLESVGIHWLIHEKSLVLSIIMLVLNMYTVLFFLADIQAVRHNPLQVTEHSLYISMGLMKRMEVKWSEIEEVRDTPEQCQQKLLKNTIEFIARDFMEVHPDVILKLKRRVPATLAMGLVKHYDQVAIRVDDPERFKAVLKGKLNREMEKA
ncbi:beta-carotene 15,15'-monooxygenase, partial [Bacillus sp. JJ1764]|uniref:beta-carotene 15,15'-monooxygenase n=1 Tax=Bacillus sp. JJ1764 TaxID=3122964 RepID=UPI002FFDBF7D